MKKSILAVAGIAAFAGIAMPLGGAFADGTRPTTSVKDDVSVTLSQTCTLTRTGAAAATGSVITAATWNSATGTTDGAYAVTLVAGKAAKAIGTSTLTTVCNDTTNGYQLDVAFTGLTISNTETTIPYDGSKDVADGTSSWNITNQAGTGTASRVTATGGAGQIFGSTTTATSGATNTIVYNVGTAADQPAGTYAGSATYTLTYGAAS